MIARRPSATTWAGSGPALADVQAARRLGSGLQHLGTPPGVTYSTGGAIATVLGPRDDDWLDVAIADPRRAIDIAPWWADATDGRSLMNQARPDRYADMPIFLEVGQVIAGYRIQSAIGGSFTAGNFTAGIIGPFTATGSANAAGTYTNRPTVVYQPLTGVDFLKRLMTPVPPSSVRFMLQSGYAADRIMPIMLDSINGHQQQVKPPQAAG